LGKAAPSTRTGMTRTLRCTQSPLEPDEPGELAQAINRMTADRQNREEPRSALIPSIPMRPDQAPAPASAPTV
jgi:hypothetical protein